MKIGTAQVEITPAPGGELSGFAARLQPSTGVLDPLYAKALYFETAGSRFLWIHCDLIGFDSAIVRAFRRWAADHLMLAEDQVMLSASHTHSGPCTIHLREAGEYDTLYVDWLHARLRDAARAAVAGLAPCSFGAVEGRLDLAVDRRGKASAHVDPRVAGLGFRRPDGAFAAVLVNYAIHPVALGPQNRLISGDLTGQAAAQLAAQLPGNPVVLATNGACANLNPPAENVSPAQVKQWGGKIAEAVGPLLREARFENNAELRTRAVKVPLPLDVLDADGINRAAGLALKNPVPLQQWGEKYRRVVEHWRTTLLQRNGNGQNGHHEAELFGLRFGSVALLGVNAEVFSQFTDMVRGKAGEKTYLVGYANGDVGYLPTRAAYAEGGYEVDVAHMFYGGFRAQAGGFELLADRATELAAELHPTQPSPSRLPTRASQPPAKAGVFRSKD